MYFNMLLGIFLGMFFFIATIKAYTIGLKHGKQLSNAIIPKIDLSPVKTFKEYQTTRKINKEHDLVQEGINNIASYDPYEVKEGD